MRYWGTRSQQVYSELDERLQRVMDRVLHEVADVSLTDGFRDEETQNNYNETGVSKVRWPDSKHNKQPSLAVDFLPYPMPKDEKVMWAALGYIAGGAMRIAAEEGVPLRWGADWNGNGDMTDTNFFDLFHLEIDE